MHMVGVHDTSVRYPLMLSAAGTPAAATGCQPVASRTVERLSSRACAAVGSRVRHRSIEGHETGPSPSVSLSAWTWPPAPFHTPTHPASLTPPPAAAPPAPPPAPPPRPPPPGGGGETPLRCRATDALDEAHRGAARGRRP